MSLSFDYSVKVEDLGSLHFFLGIQISRNALGIFMNQHKYVTDLLKDFEGVCTKSSLVPLEHHHNLLKASDSPFLNDVTAYRRLFGRLIYLTISRPDLSYAVHVLAQHMNTPQAIHWHAALKLVGYLNQSPTQGLFFAAKTNPVLTAFCDA